MDNKVVRNGKISVLQVLAEELAEVQALRKSKKLSRNKIIFDSCTFSKGKNLFARNKPKGMMRVGQLVAVRNKRVAKK
jgi:hypothetical protein